MIDRGPEPKPKRASGIGPDDRGVSEVIAFILVFAVILGSVGLLYTTALGAMGDYQQAEQETNAVRAMEALTDNFNDVVRSNGVNQRYGELSLREGSISTGDAGTALNVTITDSDGTRTLGTDPGDRFAEYGDGVTADLGEFRYESEGARIAYEGGGLVRGDDSEDWSVVRERPQLTCGPDTAVVSLVTVSAPNRSMQSSRGLGIRMSVEDRTSAVYTEVDDVSIAVEETAYEDAWTDVLSGNWEDGSDLEGSCDLGGDGRVVVTLVDVDVEY